LAIKTEDHPIDYLKFKGKIGEGYGAGNMSIWDSGKFEIIENTKSKKVIDFKGDKINGSYVLLHTDGNKWLFFKSKK
jgi:bifunctional non-homologous end joining protein LigD